MYANVNNLNRVYDKDLEAEDQPHKWGPLLL